ncbi:histone-fold-containing protein [Lophiotrema nucula]|uniref:NCT transcriptional regulatory complex subunit A n=1 Tax=Lophiotrema nucula TaxID=690887 RepID=A0A6A5YF39_9PLEO|nr:histone-fold-containing protein [Lophiotrema nucula]
MDEVDATWAPQSPDLSTSHYAADTDAEPVHPQHQGYRGSISHIPPPFGSITTPISSPILQTKTHISPFAMPRGGQVVKDEDGEYFPGQAETPQFGNGKVKKEGGGGGLQGTEHIKIATKFPVARIKRIMQADDDVGKVAQVTPVVVSKALELFMISIVTKAASEAKARNSKRVSTVHLKEAITKDEQFDFLSEIVSKVADAPAAKEEDAMDIDGKKKKSAGRKKKKADDDDF